MRTLVGIDMQGTYKSALTLLARFRFESNEVTLTHVVDPTLPYPAFELIPLGAASADYLQALQRAAESALEDANGEARKLGLNANSLVLSGPTTPMLAEHAETMGADLIAVAASRKGALGSLFLGSVTRGLAAGAKQSVLVAKGDIPPSGPLRLVFATDHSDYANRCLDRFLTWHPKGVASVTVVTAYDLGEHEASLLHLNIPELGRQAEEAVVDHLREQCLEDVAKLSQRGYIADYKLAHGDTNDVIRTAMKEADVLVLGAQGHGFMDRLFLGSVSFHQVAAEEYPVLVIRVTP